MQDWMQYLKSANKVLLLNHALSDPLLCDKFLVYLIQFLLFVLTLIFRWLISQGRVSSAACCIAPKLFRFLSGLNLNCGEIRSLIHSDNRGGLWSERSLLLY